MANNMVITDGNPIVVTGDTDTSGEIASGTIGVTSIYWHQPTTQAHKLAIQDANGNEKFEFYCQNANVSLNKDFDPPLYFRGIYSDDMDSGTLYIFTK